MGATAIQLAVASGLHVITSASSSNHAFVKSLGAHDVFDYSSPTVVEDVRAILKTSRLVGVYDAIGNEISTTSLVAITENIIRPVPAVAVHPCEHPTATFSPKSSKFSTFAVCEPVRADNMASFLVWYRIFAKRGNRNCSLGTFCASSVRKWPTTGKARSSGDWTRPGEPSARA